MSMYGKNVFSEFKKCYLTLSEESMIFVRSQNFKTCLLTKVEISEIQSLCSHVITCQQVGEGICDWRVAGRGWLAGFLDAWGMAG